MADVWKKVQNRLPPWKGKFMSPGSRLLLTNTSLTSLPIYMMGFYLLLLGSHRKMDTIRSQFFWRGTSRKFKYHMVRWDAVTRPKIHVGLGILDTRRLNECLLVKWIWKIYKQPEDTGANC